MAKRFRREKLAPHPRGVKRWRTIVRGKGRRKRLITIAVVDRRGPRGGRTVATSIRRPIDQRNPKRKRRSSKSKKKRSKLFGLAVLIPGVPPL